MMKKNKNDNINNNSKVALYLLLALLIGMFIIFVIIFIFNYDRFLLLVHFFVFTIIFGVIIIYLINKFNVYNRNSFNLINILIELINNFLNLINCFYSYYDDTYIIIKSIYDENIENDNIVKDDEIISELNLLLKSEIADNIKNVISSLVNKKFLNIKRYELINLNDKLKTFNIEINNFLNLVEKSKKFIRTDLINRFEVYKNKNFFHEVVVEFSYYSEIISHFILAFIENRKNLANNFSEQILLMRKNIKLFIDNIQKWKNDFFDKNSKLNFDKVIEYYQLQSTQLNNFYEIVDDNNKIFENKLSLLGNMIEKIFSNISSIEEIANKINILAINASIESARSSSDGKGFKIISTEIKSLANYTKSFITNINSIIYDTNDIVKQTLTDFKSNNINLSKNINNNKETLNIFYNNLNSYYNNFLSMFESVISLNTEINNHLDKFNILIQHYDIEEQQMNNLMKIIDKFYQKNENDLNNIIRLMDEKEKKSILMNIINFVENLITTEVEEEMLDKIKLKYNLLIEHKTHKDSNIEIF